MKAQEDYLDYDNLFIKLEQLKTDIDQNNIVELRELLKVMVVGYEPQGNIVDWINLENAN